MFSSVQIIPLRSIICPSSNHLALLALRDSEGLRPPDNTKPMEEKKAIKKKNKGGRPKSEEPRTKRIDVRCSYYEYLAIESKADEAGLSVSEYLRRCALNRVIAPALTAEELEVYVQLKKYATNFVQIANYIKHKDPVLTAEVRQLVNDFNAEIKKIRKI